MNSFKGSYGRWLRKTTSMGVIPLLLTQVWIGLFCVPQTLKAGTEIRREMTWEQLPAFLEGEKKVTVVLVAEGGAVRSDRVRILPNSIHLGRVTKATNWKRHPWGSETSIARDSVKEIRLENMRGDARVGGAVLGGAGAFGLALLVLRSANLSDESSRDMNLFFATVFGAPLGGAVLGHWLGQRADRETTIITIID